MFRKTLKQIPTKRLDQRDLSPRIKEERMKV
jgi:hypothetical protein